MGACTHTVKIRGTVYADAGFWCRQFLLFLVSDGYAMSGETTHEKIGIGRGIYPQTRGRLYNKVLGENSIHKRKPTSG